MESEKQEAQEIRCKKCGFRLFDLKPGGMIIGQVIKCRKCGYKNKFERIKYEPQYETRITIIAKNI